MRAINAMACPSSETQSCRLTLSTAPLQTIPITTIFLSNPPTATLKTVRFFPLQANSHLEFILYPYCIIYTYERIQTSVIENELLLNQLIGVTHITFLVTTVIQFFAKANSTYWWTD